MDDEEFISRQRSAAIKQLATEDLDPLSIDELNARVAALKAEILRCETHRDAASRHRAAADALFGKKKP